MFNKEPGFNFICGVRRHDLGLGFRVQDPFEKRGTIIWLRPFFW